LRVRDHWILVLIVLATAAVYAQVATHDFVNFDDYIYVGCTPRPGRARLGRGRGDPGLPAPDGAGHHGSPLCEPESPDFTGPKTPRFTGREQSTGHKRHAPDFRRIRQHLTLSPNS